MTKIVLNNCYGSFSISDAAMKLYAELKGVQLFPEEGVGGLITYWTVPEDARKEYLQGEEFMAADFPEREASNAFYDANTLSNRYIDREDPDLVKVVEGRSEWASGEYAKLIIEELPEGTEYFIDEYDGMEMIKTKDGIAWRKAGKS